MEKIQTSGRNVLLKKFLLIMKLTAVLLIICYLHVSAKGFSQEKISIDLKNVEIKNALTAIQQNSLYRFVYNDDILPKNALVTAKLTDADISEVLNTVLRSTNLTYHLLDNNLVVIAIPAEKDVQQITIKGVIKLLNIDGTTTMHSSVSVIEKGTTNGTTTNENGEFNLTVTNENAVLQISYVGYKTQEIDLKGKTSITVMLEEQNKELQGVVVTALGITRQKRSLTYATQSLTGADLSNSREVNVTNAMEGKVAGLTITKTNSGPGSSNRIVFRGNRSIGNTNQPLIIVDGVRIDNTPKAFADVTLFGTRDNGDGISNINPDDIESMTVLTGASAAALYGSDAANGAVIITTKKGRTGKGLGVQVSSSAMFENPMIYPKLQNVYGQGDGGNFVVNSENSWGPKMDGQQVTDWTGKSQALTPQPDNFKDFFRTGSEFINSVALSAGTDKSQTYFSYTNTHSNGIIPNNEYKRDNFNLRQSTQLARNFSIDLKANYIVEDVINRPMTGAANHAISTLYAMPRSLQLSDIKNYETLNPDGTLTQNYWAPPTPSFQNPYWSVYRNLYERVRNRIIGLVSLKYQITPELSIQGRSSIDYYTDRGEEKDFNGTFWVGFPGGGNYILNRETNQQFNNDVLISFTKKIADKYSINVFAGASIEKFNFEAASASDQGLNAPNLFALNNAVAPQINNSLARTEKQSVYASAELGYNNYLFLDLTGRNDWNSTLPVNNGSYFFPSAGLTGIISDMVKLPAFISLLKARTSYAFVGNGTAFNQLKPSYTLAAGGNGGFLNIDRVLHDADLKPEQTRSFEGGLDLSLFKDRIGADITYYKTNTKNQILQIGVPNPSGYAFRIINAGNIQNEGIELGFSIKPIVTKNFKWAINVTYGSNKNKVLYLDSLEKKPPLSSPETLGEIVVEEGKSYGEIYTSSLQRNSSGQIVVGDNGLPLVVTDPNYYAGNYNPKWTGGVTNTFQYKSWSLSVLIDGKKGGVTISGTQALLAAEGASKQTLANRETGFIVPNSVKQDGSKNDITIKAEDYWTNVGGANPVGELFVNDATNFRVREINLSYSFPQQLLGNSFIKGATISLVGRNLFFLKNSAYGFDPESGIGTGNNQGLEYTPVPTTRSYGVYIKFNF